MIKERKKVLCVIVVLTFIFSMTSAINAVENQKPHMDVTTRQPIDVQDHGDMVVLDASVLPVEKDNKNGCTLLNGKYAVMTERSEKPKTYIDFNETPEPTESFDDIPSQFSWANYGGDWTTPARDQGSCGSCWAFSAIAVMEASINIASGYPDTDLDLSEQYVLSCLPYGGSCGGGWTDDAFEAIISTGSIGNGINGVPIESCMPYQAVDYLTCDDKCENWDYVELSSSGILWEMEEWGANHNFNNDDPNDMDIVKSWLMDRGPCSASMYATSSWSSFWSTHHDPNDWFFEEDPSYTNHAVLLVGWKDDQSVTGGGYWILKNSWGPDFGYDGFFNAAYGGQKIGDIIRWCTTPEWPVEEHGPGPVRPDAHVFADFSYSPSYPKLGDEIEFVDESQGNVVLREWDFNGDGIIDSTAKRPKYVFYEEGEYGVSLNVWSSAGLNSTVTYVVEVKEIWPPIVIASPEYYGGDDLSITFEGRFSYDVDGSIVSYHWDFDDGTTSDLSFLTHVFSEGDRIYDVVLTLTDNEGGTSTAKCDIRIDITVPPVTEAVFDIRYNEN